MEIHESLLRAVELVEKSLQEKIDYDKIAYEACFSRYHFQRLFSAAFNMPLGEYIRRRRLSLAGRELKAGESVLSCALKYGYDAPESFSRAFLRFHGVPPSKAKNSPLRFQGKLGICDIYQGDQTFMQTCTVKQMPPVKLCGFSKRFLGAPYGQERFEQESEFFSSTRAKQWLLIGACSETERSRDYCAVLNADEEGYDFFLGYALDDWSREALFDPKRSGIDCIDKFGLSVLDVPAATYAVFETKRQEKFYPVREYSLLRSAIVSFLPENGFVLTNSPELCIYHGRGEARYVEIGIPVEKR